MPEGKLFDVSERLPVNVGMLADCNPTDIHIFGGYWGDQTYYADYAGIARKYAPRSILEIGVRFGYSGISLCRGAATHMHTVRYNGMDGEFFGGMKRGGDPGTLYKSNEVANANFQLAFLGVAVAWELFHCDTQKEPIPEAVLASRYDLVNVDGDHSYNGAWNDMAATWSLLNPGGLMLVDDLGMQDVEFAVGNFLRCREADGELLIWQHYHNERDMMIIRKGG
jgi:hypothetical protein